MKKYNIQVTRVSLATPKFPHIHRKTEKGPGNHTDRYQKPGLKNIALHPLRDILFLLLYYLSFFCRYAILFLTATCVLFLCSAHLASSVQSTTLSRCIISKRKEKIEQKKKKKKKRREKKDTSERALIHLMMIKIEMDSFYSEKTGFESSRHDSALSMSRAMRSMNQHELGDRTGCISPVGEIDSKMRNPQRRRVPVAVCYYHSGRESKKSPSSLTRLQCGRCRRRKIKCSGDSGNGQGCSNCRSAGNTDCQFLRVKTPLHF